jgi:hypothetical protein
MTSRLLRIWFFVLLGIALASPPLRTLQFTAAQGSLGANAPVFHSKQQRARTVNARIATLPKARADISGSASDSSGFSLRLAAAWSIRNFPSRDAGADACRIPFYHPLRC